MEEKKKTHKQKGFFKQIILCWRGKLGVQEDENDNIVKDLIAKLLSFFACALLIGTIIVFGATIYVATTINWSNGKIFGNIAGLFLILVLIVGSLISAFILKVMANNIKQEKDRNYVIAVFSCLVGFVSLIISVIALFKGVI